jgi:hypothetical protein
MEYINTVAKYEIPVKEEDLTFGEIKFSLGTVYLVAEVIKSSTLPPITSRWDGSIQQPNLSGFPQDFSIRSSRGTTMFVVHLIFLARISDLIASLCHLLKPEGKQLKCAVLDVDENTLYDWVISAYYNSAISSWVPHEASITSWFDRYQRFFFGPYFTWCLGWPS